MGYHGINDQEVREHHGRCLHRQQRRHHVLAPAPESRILLSPGLLHETPQPILTFWQGYRRIDLAKGRIHNHITVQARCQGLGRIQGALLGTANQIGVGREHIMERLSR